MPRQPHYLVAFLLMSLLALVAPAAGAAPAAAPLPAQTAPDPATFGLPPLPRSCIGGAPLNNFAKAVCCVTGYVYLNGVPVADAEVTISAAGRTLVLRTKSDAASARPYYAALLSATPLEVQPGDSVTITAKAGGQSKSVTFIAHEGGRQEDVVLARNTVGAAWTRGEIPARSGHAMAYDAARQRVVLFGGSGRNDTWEWDGTTWAQKTTPNSPPARSGHAVAYDATRQRIVLFGGINGSNFLNDTWEWDGTTWLERTQQTSPSARSGHSMAYDAARQRVVLFGGAGLNDTWEWDGTAWAERVLTINPSVRYHHGLVYDTSRQRTVLFGGSDTWEWDGTTWAQRTPTTSPADSSGQMLVYDPVRQRTVFLAQAMWEWDGTSWIQQNTLVPSCSECPSTYDVARQRIVSFGFRTNSERTGIESVTWEWDGTVWAQRTPAFSPSPNMSSEMVYDTARQRAVLFSGNSTWEWDGARWLQRTQGASMPTRSGPGMAYDDVRQRAILFGGRGNSGAALAETWAWDGASWTQHTPAASPPVRSEHTMAYDAARQRIVLFGGGSGVLYNGAPTTILSDTWEWDGTTWTQRTPAISPPARYGHAMAYDAARQRIVLFGGRNGGSYSSQVLSDTWEWDGASWTKYTPTTSPSARTDPGLAYDVARQRTVLFGGSSGLPDTWEWDGTNWIQRTFAFNPLNDGLNRMPLLVYDAARRIQILLRSSSYDWMSTQSDTWSYDGTRWRLVANSNFTQPRQRVDAAFSYEGNGTALFFGGRQNTTLMNDTYRWIGSGWQRVTPLHLSPAARTGARLARNSDGSRLLLFGGSGANNAYLDDTWLWDSANDDWLVQSPAAKPSARARYGLTFDHSRNVWLLFGGQNSSYLADTWEFDGMTWAQRSPATSPSARSNMTLTYDVARGKAVLVGGQGNSGYLDDVWEWDGTNWTNVTPAQRISARSGHGAAYDSTRKVVIIAAGNSSGGKLTDTWEWNGSFWRQHLAASALPTLASTAMDYNVVQQRLIAFGSEANNNSVVSIFTQHVLNTPTSAPPVATINRILPRDARQGSDTIRFEGSGADADVTDVIAAYRWLVGNTVISTERSFNKPASELPLGAQTVRFEVQDDEGTWSSAIAQTIFVRTSGGATPGGKSWTLLIYAVADNNLDLWMSENAEVRGMLYRLQRAGPLPNVRVAVLYDGPTANDTRRYLLDPDGTWTRIDLSEARMNEMETLRDFVVWGRSSLPPTDHYALAIVDHANGVIGIGQDETSKSITNPRPFLSPLDVRLALQAATNDGVQKLDVVQYDGCSFGLFEDAAIAAGYTNFVVASPNTGWGVFGYDSYRQLAASAADPRAYAVSVAQRYAELVKAESVPYTIAAFDMAHFDALNSAISALGTSLISYVQGDLEARRSALTALRRTIQKYDSGQGVPFEPDNEDSYVDLVDLAQKVKGGINNPAVQAAADNVIAQALPSNQRFVAYESHQSKAFLYADPLNGTQRTYTVQLDDAHGLGLYYPPRSSSNAGSAYVPYIQHKLFAITRGNGWTSFLAQGLPIQLSGDPVPLLNNTLIPPLLPAAASEQSGKITGTVSATNGTALSNINVILYREQPGMAPGQAPFWSQVQTVTTNSSGFYEANYLPTATYRVQFRDPAGLYMYSYYRNATTLAAASDVSVPGTTVSGIDAVLANAGHITGVIRDRTGQGIGGTSVSVYRLNGPTWEQVGSVGTATGPTTPTAGSYDIGGLPSGTYRVGVSDSYGFNMNRRFAPRFYLNATTVQSATDVLVTAGQTTSNIDIQIGSGGKIMGHVYGPNSTPLQGVKIDLYRNYSGQMWRLVYTTTSNDGAYLIDGLEDSSYTVRFSDPQGVLAAEYFNDAPDISGATPIVIAQSNAVTNVDATLDAAGAVHGTVTNASTTPLAGTLVTAYRQTGAGWEAFGSTTTNANGTYTLGLRAGTYRFYFFDPSGTYADEYFDNRFKLNEATDVTVTSGATTNNINAVLDAPVPPIVQITTHASVTSDPHTGMVTVGVTANQRSTTTVSTAVACNAGSPTNVALWLGNASYPMAETPAGSSQYQATVPAASLTSGTLEARWTCESAHQTKSLGTVIPYDPSGRVTNAVTNQPIKDAIVTLYHVPNWWPRTSPADTGANTCESGLSKISGSPWSQAAPTSEGVLANPDTGTIALKANPLRTDAQGAYGWNVAQGCWYVVVQAQGYHTKISPVVGAPPAITDLHMALTPTGVSLSTSSTLFLPFVRR